MLDEIARALEQAARQGDPRAATMLDQLRRQNDSALRADHDRQQRLARAAVERAEAARQSQARQLQLAQQGVEQQAMQAAAQRARPASATAATIAGWAKPTTLRSQFVLTEVLKQPLSLRPPRY